MTKRNKDAALHIERVITSIGLGGNYVEDLRALKRGGVTADGEFLRGVPLTPGFRKVKEPGESVSLLLVLEDGEVAQGDCCAVVYGGYGGRDPVFRAADAQRVIEDELGPWLVGRDVRNFRFNAETLEREWDVPSQRLHTAIRYGASQALLHAAALSRGLTMAEVVQNEYGLRGPLTRVPVLAQSGRERYASVDRMIMKQVPAIPHGDLTTLDEIGADGERLLAYLRWMKDRIAQYAAPDYRPVFHLDVYGAIGDAFENAPSAVAEYLRRLEEEARPHPVTIECPLLVERRDEQIRLMAELRGELRRREAHVRIVADEHCNTLRDIRAFADAGAADMIQIKTPDLGSISQSVEAVLMCHQRGLLAFLGGSCNETDWASRVTVHVALATRADLIYDKPGFGVDEGYMIVRNEMERTLALVRGRAS